MDLGHLVPLESLQEYDQNARNVSKDAFTRLKTHLQMLGQHSPLLVTPQEGRLTVLGGNMRLKALKELASEDPENPTYKQIWVNVVEFVQDDANGLFSAFVNGVAQPKKFISAKDGMMEYSLSHNDRAGYYDADMLANIMPNYEIDWNEYTVDLDPPETVGKLIASIAPEDGDNELDEHTEEAVSVECPNCKYHFDPSEHTVKSTIDSGAVQE